VSALDVVNAQAEDQGLWFIAETAAEAYLQQELRKLHDAVEQDALLAAQPSPEPPIIEVEGKDGVTHRVWANTEPVSPEPRAEHDRQASQGKHLYDALCPYCQPTTLDLRAALEGLVSAVIAMKLAIPPATSLGEPWRPFLAVTGDVNIWLDKAEAALANTEPVSPDPEAGSPDFPERENRAPWQGGPL
jgi:hypothetical protein